jgi:hypothetical protein
MLKRGGSPIYGYVFLLVFSICTAIISYMGNNGKGSTVIASSSVLDKASSLELSIGGEKIVVVKDVSPMWNLKEKSSLKIEVTSDPSFTGLSRTDHSTGEFLDSLEKSPVEEVISRLTEKPFVKIENPVASEGDRYELIFFDNDRKLCDFIVGPLSFTGEEVYLRDNSLGNTYLVDRGLYFLIERIHSGG